MTKHNIKGHLNWLIKCGSYQPSQPAYSPSSTGPASVIEQILEEQSTSQRAEPVIQDGSGIGSLAEDALHPPSEPEFVRPILPASVLNAQGKDEMARLQSGTKSSHKPRLLSETIPLSLQANPVSPRVPGTSLRDRYNAQWERRAPSKRFEGSKIMSELNGIRLRSSSKKED